MKGIALIGIITLLLAQTTLLSACGGKKYEKVISYEINPKGINGNTVIEKLDSLQAILNKQTEGFSRISYLYDDNDGILIFHLMVYGNPNPQLFNNEGALKQYALVVYANTDQKYFNDVGVILRQLFAYTARFISTDFNYVEIRLIDSHGVNIWFEMKKNKLDILKLMVLSKEMKGENPILENWKSLVEPPMVIGLMPITKLKTFLQRDVVY